MMEQRRTGLEYALLALSFFRHRHDRIPLYRNPKRKRQVYVSRYAESCRIAREYIRLAREQGWRGSIRDALDRLP
ncbi:MAG: hypothetical protein D6690_14740 [Nitrospirae bacterium]|nr:MAG: hypothetical protein D6690_14740 [Nitrospirota bacterium]